VLVFQWLGLFALGIVSFQFNAGLIDGRTYFLLLAILSAACYAALGGLITAVGLAAALTLTFIRIRPTSVFSVLGAISYSVYLLHVPIGGRVVNLGTRLTPTLLNRGMILALAVVATLAVSYLFHRWIELPAQRWSAGIRYSMPPKDPTSSLDGDLVPVAANRPLLQRLSWLGIPRATP
jgi:peptidoglycan/LPS O-acetylase OafA/YrhL